MVLAKVGSVRGARGPKARLDMGGTRRARTRARRCPEVDQFWTSTLHGEARPLRCEAAERTSNKGPQHPTTAAPQPKTVALFDSRVARAPGKAPNTVLDVMFTSPRRPAAPQARPLTARLEHSAVSRTPHGGRRAANKIPPPRPPKIVLSKAAIETPSAPRKAPIPRARCRGIQGRRTRPAGPEPRPHHEGRRRRRGADERRRRRARPHAGPAPRRSADAAPAPRRRRCPCRGARAPAARAPRALDALDCEPRALRPPRGLAPPLALRSSLVRAFARAPPPAASRGAASSARRAPRPARARVARSRFHPPFLILPPPPPADPLARARADSPRFRPSSARAQVTVGRVRGRAEPRSTTSSSSRR